MRKKSILASLCSLALAASMCAPALAFADAPRTATSGSSTVTLQYIKTATGDEGFPTDDVIGVDVPATIPFAYRTDGTLVGPSADAWKITNTSVKPINLDTNAIWAKANGASRGKYRDRLSINNAINANLQHQLNMNLSLHFNDAAKTVATTYDPQATVTVDGNNMTALQAGHPMVDGSMLSANNIRINQGQSLGVGFNASIEADTGNPLETIVAYFNDEAFMSGATEEGTITWTFNLD